VTKPKTPEFTENPDHVCWTIGYNAKAQLGVYRRLNQFKPGTEAFFQWDKGWQAARGPLEPDEQGRLRDHYQEWLKRRIKKA
jgi:hypothetical protein